MASHLVIIGEGEALAWVLLNRRMAFTVHRRTMATAVRQDDEVFIYTTRGAFHNPTRDRGRVIARARASTATEFLPEPVEIAGRTFELACDLELLGLAPLGAGVELVPLVERLEAFPNKRGWKIWLRRPVLELPRADADLVRRLVDDVARAPADVVGAYLDWRAGAGIPAA